MSAEPAEGIQVGDWTVDPSSRQMSRGDRVVHLDDRALRLLLCLAGRAGEVLSIGELLDRVWPGVTVSPDSVYQAVAALRRQLGDDPRRPRYIANVPRHGYRMIAGVTSPGDAPVMPVERRRKARAALAVALAGLAAAAAAWWPMGARPFVAKERPAATVGVLPFVDMTDAMDQEVLVDNLTEDLIDRMSRLDAIRTPGPRSSFALKGRKLSTIEAARILHVDFVVDGSVRHAAEPLQLTARLVRADTGLVIWSKGYQTSVAGLEAVEGDIAAEVARSANAR